MNGATPPPSSQRQTIIAVIVLLLVAGGLFWLWQSQNDPRTDTLNRMLADDPEVSGYGYRFRVFGIDGDTAIVSTPRSPQMSVLRALEIIHPELDVSQPDTPAVIAAQKELARIQYRAKDIILSHPEIEDLRWQLDRQWYLQHGVAVQ